MAVQQAAVGGSAPHVAASATPVPLGQPLTALTESITNQSRNKMIGVLSSGMEVSPAVIQELTSDVGEKHLTAVLALSAGQFTSLYEQAVLRGKPDVTHTQLKGLHAFQAPLLAKMVEMFTKNVKYTPAEESRQKGREN